MMSPSVAFTVLRMATFSVERGSIDRDIMGLSCRVLRHERDRSVRGATFPSIVSQAAKRGPSSTRCQSRSTTFIQSVRVLGTKVT